MIMIEKLSGTRTRIFPNFSLTLESLRHQATLMAILVATLVSDLEGLKKDEMDKTGIQVHKLSVVINKARQQIVHVSCNPVCLSIPAWTSPGFEFHKFN